MQEMIQTKAAILRPVPIQLISNDQSEGKIAKRREVTTSGLTREELRQIVADQID